MCPRAGDREMHMYIYIDRYTEAEIKREGQTATFIKRQARDMGINKIYWSNENSYQIG